MSDSEIMEDIIDLCLQINKCTMDIYETFADTCNDVEISTLWKKMASDTSSRLKYWQKLKELSSAASIPNLFQNPLLVKEELQENIFNIKKIKEKGISGLNLSQQCILAFNLEFFMLHKAFATLINFTSNVLPDEITSEVNYEKHIDFFMEYLKNHNHLTPELELVGKAMRSLWEDIRTLTQDKTHDYMTGILNKRGFFQIITPMAYLAQRKAINVGFIIMDIDDFKNINDLHGHQEGDRILELIAGTVKSSVRKHDIVGRYGGDELIVFLPTVEKGFTRIISERICQNISNVNREHLPVTASIGFFEDVINEDVEETIKEYIKKADGLMYEAKKNGKGRVAGNG